VRGDYPATRHSTITVGNQKYPGLFSIHAYGRDSALFILVLVIEALGLWLLAHGYWDRNGIRSFADEGAWMPYGLAIAALILDVLAATFHHWPYKSKLNLFENELMLSRARRKTSDAEGNTRSVHDDLSRNHYLYRKHRVGFYRMISWACAGVIILLAVTKIAAIQMFLPSMIGNNLKLPIIVSYLVCAFLHIFVSGYFLSGLITKWGFPPFVPLFKGEHQEKGLHLSHATHSYESEFRSERADQAIRVPHGWRGALRHPGGGGARRPRAQIARQRLSLLICRGARPGAEPPRYSGQICPGSGCVGQAAT